MDGGRVLLSPIADSGFATVWGTFDQAENSKQKGPQSGQGQNENNAEKCIHRVKQSVVINGWRVVERVVDLGKRSNDEDQQYHDHADFLEGAHDSLFIEYRWRVQDLATSAYLCRMLLRIAWRTGMGSRLLIDTSMHPAGKLRPSFLLSLQSLRVRR
jgi:hypothetical protein